MKKKLIALLACMCALSLALIAFTGCNSSSEENKATDNEAKSETTQPTSDVTLQIFAANSLEKALPEVQALYTEKTGVKFADTQFKGSGDLVAELQGGASADALIFASKGTMDDAEEGGYIDSATRYNMFVNDLVVVTADGSTITLDSLDDLKSDKITSIAIGEPNAVPAGKYAVQSLASAGLLEYEEAEDGTITITGGAIYNKLNFGAAKVGEVATYVSEGQCDVGFVYTSDVYRYDGLNIALTVDASMHKDIVYPGAVTSITTAAVEAADFLNFCTTDSEALQIFQKYGFEVATAE